MEAQRSALIVAADSYEDPRFQKLRAPGVDATRLASVLSDPHVGAFDVETSLNVHYYEIRTQLERFFQNRGLDDFLLLHFSCHGIKDASGRLFFAASDTSKDLLEATGISAEYVHGLLEGCRSRRVLVLLDCCYSGAFTSGLRARADDNVQATERLQGRGRAVLTASNSLEYAWEGDDPSQLGEASVFTSAVVEALRSPDADRDGDGWVSVDELYDYVFNVVRLRTPNQTPSKSVQTQGSLLVARSTEVQLAASLQEALSSPVADTRLGIVPELAALLRGTNIGMRQAARKALMTLAEDDSRRVSVAAARELSDVGPEMTGDLPVREPHTELDAGIRTTTETQKSLGSQSWVATTMLVSVFLIPATAAIILTTLYANQAALLSPYMDHDQLLAMVIWITFLAACATLVGAGVLLKLAPLDRPDAGTIQVFIRRAEALSSRIAIAANARPETRSSLEQARTLLRSALDEAARRGVHWLTGTGYLAVWDRFQDAQDQFLRTSSLDDMTDIAREDLEDLDRHPVARSRAVRDRLQAAIEQLVAAAERVGATVGAEGSGETRRLRETLREVRRDVRVVRTRRLRELVRARQRFGWLILLAAIATYILVANAILTDTSSLAVSSAFFVYVIGALVGLAAALMHDFDAGDGPDLGVSAIHRLSIPVVSGLVALAGVLVLDASSFGPVLPSDGGPITGQLLVLAVIFGLLPELALTGSQLLSRVGTR